MSARHRGFFACLIGLCWASHAAARLPLTSPPEAVDSRHVELRISGDDAAMTLARATARELFHRLDLDVDVIGPDEDLDEAPDVSKTPVAIISMDFKPPDYSIVVVDGASGDEVERRAIVDDSSIETAVEAATHVAYLIVEAMLERREDQASPGTDTAAPPRAGPIQHAPPRVRAETHRAAPTAEPPSTPSKLGVGAGVLLGITSLGSSRVLPGAGVGCDLTFEQTGLGTLISLVTYAPSDLELRAAHAAVRPTAARMLATWNSKLSEALMFSLAIGPGFEWLHLEPSAAPEGVEVSRTRSVLEPLLSGLAGLRVKLGSRAYMSALGGVDISVAGSRFVAEVGDDRQLLLEPPAVRPTLLVSASAALGGTSLFAPPAEAP